LTTEIVSLGYPQAHRGVGPDPFTAGGTKEVGMAEAKTKNSLPRTLSLFVALIGCVITSMPFLFGVGGDPVPLILIGSGVTVIALGLFLFFSI
jgi:hypothetical protein